MSSSSSTLTPRRRRASPLLKTCSLAFRLGWVVLVVWNEVGEFYWSVSSCRWSKLEQRLPKLIPSSTSPRPRPTRVLLIADPQLIDFASPSFRRRPFKTAVIEFVVDTYLRKSWSVAKKFKPDAVFVLGDMLDSGRATMGDAEYEKYANRFKRIFSAPKDMPIFYLPGNRDVGLGTSRAFSPHARERYKNTFGATNQEITLGNHTFVLLDAPKLIEEDYQRYAAEVRFGEWDAQAGGSIAFLQRLGKTASEFPRILLSHVPLTRRAGGDCGPGREPGNPSLSAGAGHGYQKMLGSETSTFLMDKVKPSLIFSGDDHDICAYTHPNSVREVTVKTFSMAMGIQTPGFQLLSLVPPNAANPTAATHADMSCNLPNQLGIYLNVYLPFTLLTILILFVLNARKTLSSTSRRRADPPSPLTFSRHTRQPSSSGHSSPHRHNSTPIHLPLKSPRLSTSNTMGMTPFASPNPTRRSSRSMPPSPTASPRMGYSANTLELADDNGTKTPTQQLQQQQSSGFYFAGDNQTSPSAMENGGGSSYFLPLPGTQPPSPNPNGGGGGGIGLGISSPTLPTSQTSSSRPGQPRRFSRTASGFLAGSSGMLGLVSGGAGGSGTDLPSSHRLERPSQGGLAGAAELVTDAWSRVRVPRRVWALVGGEESLVGRTMRSCGEVFWPGWVSWVVVNLLFR